MTSSSSELHSGALADCTWLRQLHLHLALADHSPVSPELRIGSGPAGRCREAPWQMPGSTARDTSGAWSRGCAVRPPSGPGPAEQAALEQLGEAAGYATRWPVRREVARSLASRQLVVIASDYVLLTKARRRALAGEAGARDSPLPPGRAGARG